MWSPLARRMLLAALPTMIIAGLVVSTIWGDNGLIQRHRLQAELGDAREHLADLQRDNQQLLRDIRMVDEEPRAAERVVAEELSWGAPGTVLYRFPEPSGR